MAARIAWLLNLDADLELQNPATYRGRRLTHARICELRARIFDLIGEDDVILDPAQDASVHVDVDVVMAFCPTPFAIEAITSLGLEPPRAPAFNVLRSVNHRRFCAQLGQTLPNAAFVDDMDTLNATLASPSLTGSYVIKRAFSFAGRDQRRVHAGILDDSTRGFCERSFALGEGVQVEPWMDRIADVSQHGYLDEDGALHIGEPRAQLNDALGRFQHMQADAPLLTDTQRAMLTTELERVACALRQAGYFGPFGIDAFTYRAADGSIALDPRCEINARFTMGFPRALLLQALSRDDVVATRRSPSA